MKRYRATKNSTGVLDVQVEDGANTYLLPMRLDLRNHSPTGFQSGYNGSGPAQLALALLADALGDSERALDGYQDIKFKLISRLPGDGWELSRDDLIQELIRIESERGRSRS